MKIIILNGKIGSGKSFVGSKLHQTLKNSAYIEGDAFLQINPFNPTTQNYHLVAKNIAKQVKIYQKFKNIEYVIISWVIWDKKTFDILSQSLNIFNIYPILLVCPQEILEKRLKEDVENNKRFCDNLEKTNRPIYTDGFEKIMVDKSSQAIVDDIIKIINN